MSEEFSWFLILLVWLPSWLSAFELVCFWNTITMTVFPTAPHRGHFTLLWDFLVKSMDIFCSTGSSLTFSDSLLSKFQCSARLLKLKQEEHEAGVAMVWILKECRAVGKSRSTLPCRISGWWRRDWSEKYYKWWVWSHWMITRWLEVQTGACGRFQNWDISWWSYAWRWEVAEEYLDHPQGSRVWAESAMEEEFETDYTVE